MSTRHHPRFTPRRRALAAAGVLALAGGLALAAPGAAGAAPIPIGNGGYISSWTLRTDDQRAPVTGTAGTQPADPGQPTTAGTTPAAGPAAGKKLTFADDFDNLSVGTPGSTWSHTSSSYAYGDHNPDDSKLDWTTPDAMAVNGGVLTMTATPRGDGYWNTGLLTTEASQGTGGNGVRLQPGDFYVSRTRMPDTGSNSGAWPAMWAWSSDYPNGAEVDPYEYHNDNPNLLEIGTSQCQCGDYYTNADLVAPGKWVWVGMLLGDTNNQVFVGSTLDSMTKVWEDGTGLQGGRPHPMVNLSVSDGTYHEKPSGSTPITFQVDAIRIYH